MEDDNRKRFSLPREFSISTKLSKTTHDGIDKDMNEVGDDGFAFELNSIMDPLNDKIKTAEKLKSVASHFNFFLSKRKKELLAKVLGEGK